MRSAIEILRQSAQRAINHPHFISACLIFATLLRLLWIWLVDVEQVSDFKWYYERGLDIASGKGYAVEGVPTAYWPVGYPGFLGLVIFLFGPSVLVGKLTNLVLYLGTILLAYHLSKRIFHSECAARITLFLLSFYPNHIAYTALLSSEIFFVFLLLLAAVLFMAAQQNAALLLVSGASFGMATLTKPQVVLVPLIFLFVFSKNAKSFLKSGAIVFGMMLLVVSPWIVRNYSSLGTYGLCTDGGIDLLFGNNPYANGRYQWDENVNSLLGDLRTPGPEKMFDGKEVARDARARSIATNYIIHNPGRTILLWPRKFVALYLSDVDGIYYSLGIMQLSWDRTKRVFLGLRVVAELYYIMIIMLFFFSLGTVLCNKVKHHQIGIAIIVYFTLIYLVFFGNARYHFPSMPWVAIYSGIGGELVLYGRKHFILASKREAP